MLGMQCGAAAVTVLLLLALPAAAQEEQLGQVAGTISLKKPEGQPVVIDSTSLPAKAPPTDVRPYPVQLADFVERYRAAVKQLESTLDRMNGSMVLYDPAWREQVEDDCRGVESVGVDVESSEPPAEFTRAYLTAKAAASEYNQAVAVVRTSIASRTPTIGQRIPHLASGRETLDLALQLARQTESRTAGSRPPTAILQTDAYAAADHLCSTRSGDDPDAYRSCVAAQRAAVDQLASRSAFLLGLDDGTFNAMRNRCESQSGEDFEKRNACELSGIAALPPH